MQEINVNLHLSKIFLFVLIALTLGSCFLIVWLALPVAAQVILVLCALGYGLSIIWRIILRQGKGEITRLSFNGKSWVLQDHQHVFPARLLGETTLTQFVSILRFSNLSKQKITCIIFRDMMNREQYRKLLIALKTC